MLTMHDEPPLVFDSAVRDERIFGSTCQVLAIVIYNWNEREYAQWLVARFRKLRKKIMLIKKFVS